jgi:hypothetical protein
MGRGAGAAGREAGLRRPAAFSGPQVPSCTARVRHASGSVNEERLHARFGYEADATETRGCTAFCSSSGRAGHKPSSTHSAAT